MERFIGFTNMVSYRGPDDSGYLALNSTDGTIAQTEKGFQPFDIFLGHRRLSIIDMSPAGRQPMTDGSGLWIVFNGEIFNYVELREELKSQGYRFRTNTDTEVILHLYDRFGQSGFERMNGMWALAMVDLRSRRLLLSCDRFSIKPLYLHAHDDEMYFASEIKQLLPLIPQKKPNLEVLSTFLAQGLLDHSEQTFFCGITRVPPRTNVVVDLSTGSPERRAYWDFGRRECSSLAGAEEELRELLIDSTRIRLRSDVKIGLLLSGGLDSSSLAVAAKQAGAEELETYSVVSDEREFSEERFIEAVNQALGLKSVRFTFRVPHVEEALNEVLRHSDEPVGGVSAVAQYLLFQTIKKNSDVTVLLSGQGGDEVLLGYLKFFFFHLRELLRRGKYGAALHQFLSTAIRRTVIRQFRLSEAKRYLPFSYFSGHKALRMNYKPVNVGATDGIRSRQIADIEHFSVPALTHYEDRNSMAHSLEVRHPFLDHRIVDLALSVRPEWQFNGGWTKRMLRESFPELPEEVRWRRDKQGFTTPEERWLKNELAPLLDRAFEKSTLDEFGLVDSKAVLRQNKAFRKGSSLVSYGDISRTFMAEVWAKQHWGQASAYC